MIYSMRINSFDTIWKSQFCFVVENSSSKFSLCLSPLPLPLPLPSSLIFFSFGELFSPRKSRTKDVIFFSPPRRLSISQNVCGRENSERKLYAPKSGPTNINVNIMWEGFRKFSGFVFSLASGLFQDESIIKLSFSPRKSFLAVDWYFSSKHEKEWKYQMKNFIVFRRKKKLSPGWIRHWKRESHVRLKILENENTFLCTYILRLWELEISFYENILMTVGI